MQETERKSILIGGKKEKRKRNTFWLFVIVLSLIVLTGLLYFIFFHRAKKTEVVWKEFSVADLREDRLARESGQESAYSRLMSMFLRKGKAGAAEKEGMWLTSVLEEQHEVPGDRSTPFVFRETSSEFVREDQLILGELYVARGDQNAFSAWRKAIHTAFPEYRFSKESAAEWPFALAYIRVLMEGYQQFGRQELISDIQSLADDLRIAFEEGLSANKLIHAKTPQLVDVGLIDPSEQSLSESKEVLLIRLADLDLAVLEALADMDPKWRDIADTWGDIMRNAKLSNGFYAYGYDSEQNYITSEEESYYNSTLSGATQIRHLCEAGFVEEAESSLSLYLNLFQRDQGLRDTYHMMSLTPASENINLQAYTELYRAALISENYIMAKLLAGSLEIHRYKGEVDIARGMLFKTGDSKVYLPLKVNAEALLAGMNLTVK